jgi:putative spermidine/putrescine transport system substrate-binding protein
MASTSLAAPNVFGQDPGRLVYSGFGGTYQEAFTAAIIRPFEAETGIKVTITTGAPNVALSRAQVEARRVEWDCLEMFTGNYQQLARQGLLEQLDYSAIDTSEIFDKELITPYFAPSHLFSTNPWWNTKTAPGKQVAGWADMWDFEKIPGKRGISNDFSITLEAALIADGVSPKSLYPLNVNRALTSLKKLTDKGAVIKGINEITNLLSIQEISTSVGGPALPRIQRAIRDGVPVQYTWNQYFVDPEGLGVLKGAPNLKNAMKFVAYQLRPEVQLARLEALSFTPTVKVARAKIPQARGADLPASDQTPPGAIFLNGKWYAEFGDVASRQFQNWILSVN